MALYQAEFAARQVRFILNLVDDRRREVLASGASVEHSYVFWRAVE